MKDVIIQTEGYFIFFHNWINKLFSEEKYITQKYGNIRYVGAEMVRLGIGCKETLVNVMKSSTTLIYLTT